MNFLTNIQAAQWILNLVFNSMIIVGFGWVLARILRRKAAPVRSGLILMILIILMLLPILSLIPSIPHLIPFQITLPISISSSVEANIDSHLAEIEGVTSETLPPYTRNRKFLPSISGLFLIRIINAFGIIWGLGFLACFIRFIYGTKSLRSFKNGLVKINETKMTRILKSVENTFGKRIRFSIFLTNSLTTPIVMGIFRPIVVFPRKLYIRWNENTVKSILLHELSHIYHKDNFTGILQRVATSLNWWNPLVFNLSADFSRAREEISDNHVLLENNSRDYAECLIKLAENKSLISRLAVFTPITSPYIPLNDRVKYILSKEKKMETHMKKSSILLILGVFVFLLGVTAGCKLALTPTTDSSPTPESIQEKSTEDEKISPPPPPKKIKVDKEKKTPTSKAIGGVMGGVVGGVIGGVAGGDQSPVRAVGDIKPPKLIQRVEPIYPKVAREASIEGVVIVEATTGIYGRVQNVKVLRSIPLLDQAAIDSVFQWVYEPFVIDGKPRGVIFTVTVVFKLDKTQGPVRAVGDIKPPRLIKRVDPIYPQKAKEAQIEGTVILEVTTGIYGRVQNVKTLRSVPPLDQAAMDAVLQWVYEPFVIDGQPRGVIFTVTVVFKIK